MLYHDGQYTAAEYSDQKGWGHSSFEDALDFASQTNAKRLIIGHHDPNRSDGQLDQLSIDLAHLAKRANLKCEFAEEKKEYVLK